MHVPDGAQKKTRTNHKNYQQYYMATATKRSNCLLCSDRL